MKKAAKAVSQRQRAATAAPERVNIRPGVTVLSILRHLNYKPWFALAEFVDNSIQSALSRHSDLRKADGDDYALRVEIEISDEDDGRVTVRDNAAGIDYKDFPRAFRPAEVPPDRTGLSEFGMGMKSAACWFSPKWTVRTSALGEAMERSITFDINQIVNDELEELDVDSRASDPRFHFTEIILSSLHHKPTGRTITKIKEHLTDIYRCFVRDGSLILTLNGNELHYEEPEILEAPFYRDEGGSSIKWRAEFDFDFGDGQRAHGFAAIRQVASTSRAGFALFRRKRLIEGSGDEGYRPEFIFGMPNSFVYQRVFGEIHLEGFEVSHTKDGFQWDENEQPFLEILKEQLSEQAMPLLQQAREHRVTRKRQDYIPGAEAAATRTSEAIRDHVPGAMTELCQSTSSTPLPTELSPAASATRRTIDIVFNMRKWRVVVEMTADPAVGDWLEISEQIAKEEEDKAEGEHRVLGLRLSLIHPFMDKFGGTEPDRIEPLLRIAVALGLAEIAAREGGVRKAGTVRRNVNELLRSSLWQT